jgi:hypothetical protein
MADHDSVALPPLVTALGPTLRLTEGAAAFTETVADWLALPPELEQVNVYVVSADNTPVDDAPLRDLLPDQPPDAEHDVAFALFHCRLELVPAPIVLG